MTEKQQEYNKKWAEKNKVRKRKLSYRSTSRTFIRNYADKSDLEELKELIEKKLKEFK